MWLVSDLLLKFFHSSVQQPPLILNAVLHVFELLLLSLLFL